MASTLVSCPLCLKPESLTLSDLCSSLIHLTSSAFTNCPVCNVKTAGLAGLVTHLMGHQTAQVTPQLSLDPQRNHVHHVKVEHVDEDKDESRINFPSGTQQHQQQRMSRASDNIPYTSEITTSPTADDDLEDLLRDFSEIIGEEEQQRNAKKPLQYQEQPYQPYQDGRLQHEQQPCENYKAKHHQHEHQRPNEGFAMAVATTTSSSSSEQFSEGANQQPHAMLPQPHLLLPPLPPSNGHANATTKGSMTKALKQDNHHQHQQQVQCGLCGWNFDDDGFLNLHKVLMHSNGPPTRSDGAGRDVQSKFLCRHCKQQAENPIEPMLLTSSQYSLPASQSPVQFSSPSALEDYRAHLQSAHQDPRFVCAACGKLFKLRGSLLVHERVVHNPAEVGNHACGTCGRKFNNKYRRDIHERRHQSNRLRCSKCTKTFEDKSDLERHGSFGGCPGRAIPRSPQSSATTTLNPSSHNCNVCNESFESKAALILHSVGHIKQQQHRELPPSSTITSISSLLQTPLAPLPLSEIKQEPTATNSFSTVGGGGDNNPLAKANSRGGEGSVAIPSPPQISLPEEDTTFQCQTSSPMCPTSPAAAPVASPTSPKQWQCDICHKSFTTKYFLKKHNRLHTGETPYECHLCGRAFTFQQSYHKHMLYHTDEKPYTCSTCGRSFKELSTLQNHERIHTGERPFECESCGKSFRQRVSYLVHRRIHTGVMPYSCSACGKHFRYKVTQRTHKCIPNNQLAKTTPAVPALPQQIQEELRNFRKVKKRSQGKSPDTSLKADSPLGEEIGQLRISDVLEDARTGFRMAEVAEDTSNPFENLLL